MKKISQFSHEKHLNLMVYKRIGEIMNGLQQEPEARKEAQELGRYKRPLIIRIYPALSTEKHITYGLHPEKYSWETNVRDLFQTAVENVNDPEELEVKKEIEKRLRDPTHLVLIGGKEASGALRNFIKPDTEPKNIEGVECYILDYRVALPHELGKMKPLEEILYSV